MDYIVQPTVCSRCSSQTCNKSSRGSPLHTGVSHVPLMHFMKPFVELNPGSHANAIVSPSWKVCFVCFNFPWWTLGRAPHSSSAVKTDTFQYTFICTKNLRLTIIKLTDTTRLIRPWSFAACHWTPPDPSEWFITRVAGVKDIFLIEGVAVYEPIFHR